MHIHVAMASDENYARHMGAAIVSLFDNNRKVENITIHILEQNISESSKRRLEILAEKYKRKIKYYDFSNIDKMFNLKVFSDRSLSAYSRIFLPNIISEEIDRIIYFDVDGIVNSSIEELWSIDLNNNLVAGVEDFASVEKKREINLKDTDLYINSGMLVINLDLMRKEDTVSELLEFIEVFKGKVPSTDQGTINGVLSNRILKLPPKYNAMTPIFDMKHDQILKHYSIKNYYSRDLIQDAIANPTFIHFVPGYLKRPWHKNCKHPKSHLYNHYISMTEWKNENKYIKDNRSLKVKLVGNAYRILPFNVFNFLYKLLKR